MFMMSLRAFLSVIFQILLIPVKIVVVVYLIGLMIYDVYIAQYFTFEEWMEISRYGLKKGFEEELYWIRTGKFI